MSTAPKSYFTTGTKQILYHHTLPQLFIVHFHFDVNVLHNGVYFACSEDILTWLGTTRYKE